MNAENFVRVLNWIKSNPEHWDQAHWHCSTVNRFGGLVQIMSGKQFSANVVRRNARVFLDVSMSEADYLFSKDRTIGDFERFLSNRVDLDRDGFDRAGFDREGFDRTGFDHHGFDRDGLNMHNKEYDANQVV